ncbi:hypothetical protein HUJ04_005214 [Dendroctonus ponderosae]|nr:hypothetical protein HUJ04_005214 [Dendroctonus ponderosae]
MYASAGDQGRTSDGGVFKSTSFHKLMEESSFNHPQNCNLLGRQLPVPYTFAADDTFPLTTAIVKPYSGHQEKLKKSSKNEITNLILRYYLLQTFHEKLSLKILSMEAWAIRDEYAEYIMTKLGQVPWQYSTTRDSYASAPSIWSEQQACDIKLRRQLQLLVKYADKAETLIDKDEYRLPTLSHNVETINDETYRLEDVSSCRLFDPVIVSSLCFDLYRFETEPAKVAGIGNKNEAKMWPKRLGGKKFGHTLSNCSTNPSSQIVGWRPKLYKTCTKTTETPAMYCKTPTSNWKMRLSESLPLSTKNWKVVTGTSYAEKKPEIANPRQAPAIEPP